MSIVQPFYNVAQKKVIANLKKAGEFMDERDSMRLGFNALSYWYPLMQWFSCKHQRYNGDRTWRVCRHTYPLNAQNILQPAILKFYWNYWIYQYKHSTVIWPVRSAVILHWRSCFLWYDRDAYWCNEMLNLERPYYLFPPLKYKMRTN